MLVRSPHRIPEAAGRSSTVVGGPANAGPPAAHPVAATAPGGTAR